MRAADAPYVPEFQPRSEPVAGLGVPALGNGYLSEMDEPVGGRPAEVLVGRERTLRTSWPLFPTGDPLDLGRVATPSSARGAAEDQAAEVVPLPAAPPQSSRPGRRCSFRPAATASSECWRRSSSGAPPRPRRRFGCRLRPAPPAGPSVTPPMPSGSGTPSAGDASPASPAPFRRRRRRSSSTGGARSRRRLLLPALPSYWNGCSR